jgi:hypothetical protein
MRTIVPRTEEIWASIRRSDAIRWSKTVARRKSGRNVAQTCRCTKSVVSSKNINVAEIRLASARTSGVIGDDPCRTGDIADTECKKFSKRAKIHPGKTIPD